MLEATCVRHVRSPKHKHKESHIFFAIEESGISNEDNLLILFENEPTIKRHEQISQLNIRFRIYIIRRLCCSSFCRIRVPILIAHEKSNPLRSPFEMYYLT